MQKVFDSLLMARGPEEVCQFDGDLAVGHEQRRQVARFKLGLALNRQVDLNVSAQRELLPQPDATEVNLPVLLAAAVCAMGIHRLGFESGSCESLDWSTSRTNSLLACGSVPHA